MGAKKAWRMQTMLSDLDHEGLVWLAERRQQNASELLRTLVQDAVRTERAMQGSAYVGRLSTGGNLPAA